MIESELLRGVLAGLIASGTALFLRTFARDAGWTDDGSEAPERKIQRAAVPLVGGVAVFLGLWFLAGSTPVNSEGGVMAPLPAGFALHVVRGYSGVALLGALLLGAIDDRARVGLRPSIKFAGQLAIAVLCARDALDVVGTPSIEHALACGTIALLAMNAFNTFDNADGCATSLAALGLGVVSPLLAAPLLGFLPFNLWLRRTAPDGSTTPLAYLGDAGSHLLGVLVALTPGAWPVLALPLLDLARLSVVRWKRGSRPWIGDRRHLAHRLQARGLGPTAVVLALLAVAAPSVLGAAFAAAAPWALAAGLAGTLALFLAALALTPDVP